MAKNNPNIGQPVDQPIVLRPGVMHRESDYHGSGKHYALEPEHPERAEKGDLGLSTIEDFESRPLSHEGLPFVLKE
ncbi:MAG: hypothetical protein V3W28_01505 [Thermoplasmata archaeon]